MSMISLAASRLFSEGVGMVKFEVESHLLVSSLHQI